MGKQFTQSLSQNRENRVRPPVIVAERKLIHVFLEMLRGNEMMRPVHRAFQLRPEAVNGLRVDFAANIFLVAMIDFAMAVSPFRCVAINRQFIRVNGRPVFHVASYVREHVGSGDGIDNLRNDVPATLDKADDRRLTSRTTTTLARPDAAVIRFVCLNDAGEFRGLAVCHELADFVIHAPRGLVGHSKLALQFLRGNAVLAGRHEENCKEPRLKFRAGFVKDRASGGIDLMPAPRTGIRAAFFNRVVAVFLLAFRALQTTRPASLEHEIQAGAFGRELRLKLS